MQHYKRPPITEAVVEFRFGNTIPMATIEKVRDRLVEYYPLPVQTFMTANLEILQDASTRVLEREHGYRLTAGDGTGVVTVAPHLISTSRLAPYEGWESFVEGARRNWDVWKKQVGWQKVARVGVRYVNRIDIPATDELLHIEKYLTFSLSGPAIDLPPLQSYALNAVRALGKDDCKLVLNSGLVASPLVKTVSVLLDLDISREVEVPQNDETLWALVNRIREYKNEIFEACITEQARELFQR
jgi:uncharacterized protein (TIGR04255 family)